MSFPESVAESALLNCGRHCCLCHKFCGTKIELHHIVHKADKGEDTYENCIPLCFDCHAEVIAYNPKHPKGRKYTETELRIHRDRWYEKVKNSMVSSSNPSYAEVGKEIFRKFREALPSTGSIEFFREHNFGDPFEAEKLSDLFAFIQSSTLPENEFLDMDLEGLRAKLIDAVQDFVEKSGIYTFTWRQDGWNHVPEYNSRTDEPLTNFRSRVKELNDGAISVCNAYDELIRVGRRKLFVV